MRSIYSVLLLLTINSIQAQNTVGLIYHDSLAQNGYTLFAPLMSKQTYLVNICGEKVREWTSQYTPGGAVYLTKDGMLARSANVQNPIFIWGGTAGAIEFFSWEGELIRTLWVSSPTLCSHHDFALMPNGNVLVLAWELKSYAQAISAGRMPLIMDTTGICPDMVLEYALLPNDEEQVVWTWHAWDHLVQEFDSTKENFGVVSEHPEKINMNVHNNIVPMKDWMHCNSISYNAELDQIMLSSLCYNEIWIIDHSTTPEEAAGNSGGYHLSGGDLIYRYGNPRMYHRGDASDQKFFGQHNAHWIPDGFDYAGQVMVFNNNAYTNPAGSSVNIFKPPVNIANRYILPWLGTYGPDQYSWVYNGPQFHASYVSGATMMPNGNVLICSGPNGKFFEVNQEGEIHWEYMCPVQATPVSQGTVPVGHLVFRAERYFEDFDGFAGKDMEVIGSVELDPVWSECVFRPDIDSTIGISERSLQPDLLSGLVSDYVRLVGEPLNVPWSIVNTNGQLMGHGQWYETDQSIDLATLPEGFYALIIHSYPTHHVHRFVKIGPGR